VGGEGFGCEGREVDRLPMRQALDARHGPRSLIHPFNNSTSVELQIKLTLSLSVWTTANSGRQTLRQNIVSSNFPSLRNEAVQCRTLRPITICQMKGATNVTGLYSNKWCAAKAVHQLWAGRSKDPKGDITFPLENEDFGMPRWSNRSFK
jgi:hypothetical protein